MKPYVPKRIHEWNADMKLIFILRDPVERAISDYAQAVSNKQNEQRSFEKLIFKKRKKGGAPGRSNEINPKSSKVKYLKISSRIFPPCCARCTGFCFVFLFFLMLCSDASFFVLSYYLFSCWSILCVLVHCRLSRVH